MSVLIEDLQSAKHIMEMMIKSEVQLAVQMFRDKTGFCPRCININLLAVTYISDKNKQYMVESVNSEIDILN